MKQFLKVLSVVKFIVEAAAMLVVSLFRIRAAILPPAVEMPETDAFPALLPRIVAFLPCSSGDFKPFAPRFYPAAATVCPRSPSRIILFRSRRALIASPIRRPRGGFAGGMSNRRLSNHTD